MQYLWVESIIITQVDCVVNITFELLSGFYLEGELKNNFKFYFGYFWRYRLSKYDF